MILQNMTPEEKVRQASKIELDIRYASRSWVEHNQRLLKKRQSYPYTHIIKREFKDMGVWNIMISFEEKPKFSKGVLFSSNAYQKYYVSKGTKAENIGAGIYFIGGAPTRNGYQGSGTSFYELTPHFFNRYRERYLKAIGQGNMSFNDMFMSVYRDISVGISPDKDLFSENGDDDQFFQAMNVPRVPGYENLAMFIRHGLCLGFSTHREDYLCYLTYVGHEEFFKWQSKIHNVSKKLLEMYDQMKEIDPYYMVDKEKIKQGPKYPSLIKSSNKSVFPIEY